MLIAIFNVMVMEINIGMIFFYFICFQVQLIEHILLRKCDATGILIFNFYLFNIIYNMHVNRRFSLFKIRQMMRKGISITTLNKFRTKML